MAYKKATGTHCRIRFPECISHELSTAMGTRLWLNGTEISGLTAIHLDELTRDRTLKLRVEFYVEGLQVEHGDSRQEIADNTRAFLESLRLTQLAREEANEV